MAGCKITFFFVSNCEAFEIVGTSGPARINGALNSYLGPQPGKVYSLQFQQGETVEIQGVGTSLNPTSTNAQVLVAFIGQATGGDATHLTDTNRNWIEGWFQYNTANKPNLVILSGSGAGKSAPITDNTNNTLTFTATPGMVPDNSSEYALVWNVGDMVNFGTVTPVIFTVPETGAYTIEISAPIGFNLFPGTPDPYGRGTYVLQKTDGITGVPLAWPLSATYDSVRDVFWVIDNPSSNSLPVASYVNKISTGGLLLSRTAIAASGYGTMVYCPNIDRLALVSLDTGDLVIVDPATSTVESTTALGIPNAGDLFLSTFCPSNGFIYAPGGVVIDPSTKTVVTTIVLPGSPARWVATFIPGDGNIWYSTSFDYGSYSVQVVDPATNLIIHTILIPTNTLGGQLAYSVATGLVYGSGKGHPASLTVIDPATYTLLRQVNLDQAVNVNGMVVGNDGFLYAGTEAFGTELSSLVKIDLATESIVSRILAPPQNMILYLSTGGVIGMLSFGSSSLSNPDWNGNKSFAVFTP